MQAPAFKNEWNVTTVISLAAFAITFGGGIYGFGQVTTEITSRVQVLEREAVSWRETHMGHHRERAQEIAIRDGRTEERLNQVEQQSRAIDNLTYRMTVQEQGTTSLAAAVAELRQTINDVTADIRLIREIVTRMDEREPAPAR